MIKDIIRALRLSFLSASILAFVCGSLIARRDFNLLGFLLGLITVACTHLSANLINDYADAKSGADWQDRNFYGFFGGSKLIQENIFSQEFYFRAAVICALICGLSALLLAYVLNSLSVIIFYSVIIILSWSYSTKPLQFSYHRLGEIFIFLLFGPALVMGGYFIQTKIFPDLRSLLVSLPFGFFTTAILFANEVPDFNDDIKAQKFTWVSITGRRRAYLLYWLLIALGFSSIILNVMEGNFRPWTLISLLFICLSVKAAGILKKYPHDKMRLVESSKLTIAVQGLVSLVLILGVI